MVSDICVPQSLAQVLAKGFGLWASRYGANGQITMTMHKYRSRQFHETSNGVNPPSSYRDTHSAKCGPNLWQIWQVFGSWASPYGANGQIGIWVPQVWQQPARPTACPNRDDNTPPANYHYIRNSYEIDLPPRPIKWSWKWFRWFSVEGFKLLPALNL